jgi:sugar lactone lactonase YvrE
MLQRVATAFIALLTALFSLPISEAITLRVSSVLYRDAKGVALQGPESIACRGGDTVVVADTGNRRLVAFNDSDGALTPQSEIRVSQIRYPTRARFASGGDLLVLDGRSKRIVRVSPSGQFLRYVDVEPGGEPDTVLPRSFALDDRDNLYILDAAGRRVLVTDNSGKRLREIVVPEQAGFLTDIAVDSSGHVFVIDSLRKQILVARAGDAMFQPLTVELKADMAFPSGLDIDSSGDIFVSDRSGGGIVVVGPGGAFEGRMSRAGWREGFLRYPSGVCISRDRLFVADTANNRVQVFSIVR